MKRKLVLAGLLGCALIPAFSMEEAWFGFGTEFGNTFIFADKSDTAYLGAWGGNLSMHLFRDKNPFGIFMRASFLRPVTSRGLADDDNYDLAASFSLGAAGRLAITDAFALYGGLGLDGFALNRSYYRRNAGSEEDYQKAISSLGIGGHIGIKYDITGFLYLDIGCTLSYLFYSRLSLRSYTKENGTADYIRQEEYLKDYSLLAVKPYIGVGFNWYSESEITWGKPK